MDLAESIRLPLLKEVLPGGLSYGANYLVEFEPNSLWFETCLTLAAQALRNGIRTDYHTFTRSPDDIKSWLHRLGLDIKRFEEDDTFRIWDSYTVQTGIGPAARIGTVSQRERIDLRSVKIADWDKGVEDELKGEIPQVEKSRLHLDDNTSVLLQYNDEKQVVEHFRTRTIPYARKLQIAAVHSVLVGTYSDTFYKQFESFCDGIIDFKSAEEGGKVVNYMRIRVMRGKSWNSEWRPIDVDDNGEVRIAGFALSKKEVMPMQESRIGAGVMAAEIVPKTNIALTLGRLDTIRLSRFRIVGDYARFDEVIRNKLKDARQRILSGIERTGLKSENYLFWSQPGAGKSFFVQQVGESVKGAASYFEVNISRSSESDFRSKLAEMEGAVKPSLCFVDEVDSMPNESWPCEALLTFLDGGARATVPRVTIVAGSSGSNLEDFKRIMRSRPKGSDMLSRIPQDNEFTIPATTPEDRFIIAAANIKRLSSGTEKGITEIEKLALHYTAIHPNLASPRQIREFIAACLERVPRNEDRIRYDNLFDPGDEISKEFWIKARSESPELIGKFVRIEE